MPLMSNMTAAELAKKKADEAKPQGATPMPGAPGAPTGTAGGAAAPMPGTPAASGGGAAGAPSAAPAKGPASSGHFTNVQQYIAANKGAGQRMGSAISNMVQGQIGKATEATTAAAGVNAAIKAEQDRLAGANMSIFDRPVAGAPGTSGLGVKPVKGAGLPVGAGSSFDPNGPPPPGTVGTAGMHTMPAVQKPYQLPSEFMPKEGGPTRTPGAAPIPGSQLEAMMADPQKAQELKNLLTGTTQFTQLGQKAIGLLDTAQSELTDAQKLAGMTGSETGRFELLRKSLGRPSYSGGQQSLDQLLIQGDPKSGLNALQQKSKADAAAATAGLASTATGIQTGLTAGSQEANRIAGEMKSKLGGLGTKDDPSTPNVDESKGTGAFGALQADLEDRRKAFVDTEKAKEAKVKAAIGSTDINGADPEVLKQLGLAPGANLYDTDLSKIITSSFAPDTITAQNIADEKDLGWYNALNKLAGTDSSFLKQDQINKAKGFEIDPKELAALKTSLASGATRVSDLRDQLATAKAGKTGTKWVPDLYQPGESGGMAGTPKPNAGHFEAVNEVNQAGVADLQKQIDALLKRTVGGANTQKNTTPAIVPGNAPITAIPAKNR